MQITIDIDDHQVASQILEVLESYKKKGIKVFLSKQDTSNGSDTFNSEVSIINKQKNEYTDEYIEKHWKEIAYAASGNLAKEDDDILEEEYGKYLYEKHNI